MALSIPFEYEYFLKEIYLTYRLDPNSQSGPWSNGNEMVLPESPELNPCHQI